MTEEAEIWIKRHDRRRRCPKVFSSETGRTKQSFRDDCDINVIIDRMLSGAQVPTVPGPNNYGDFSDATDYQDTVNRLMAFEEYFSTVPAKIRERFKNDPAQLMLFMDDSANQEEAVSLGLAEAPVVEELDKPIRVVVTTDETVPAT